MSKRETIIRYNTIINQLRKKKSTFDEIHNVLKKESDLLQYNLVIGKRTFKRDLDDILSLYNIEIKFNFKEKKYFIEQLEDNNLSDKYLEAFDMFNALNMSSSVSDFIHFDSRKPQGTAYLFTIITAIKNKNLLTFKHQKFWEDEVTNRIVQPLALKESQNRWYLIAKDLKDENIKTFGLDRIVELDISKKKFVYPKDFKVEEFFKYSFGIINIENENPHDIVLSFTPYQAKFIKTLPIHTSQQIILDNKNEMQIKLKLHITDDLIMEILSYGNQVKVLKPKILITKLKNIYSKINYDK